MPFADRSVSGDCAALEGIPGMAQRQAGWRRYDP